MSPPIETPNKVATSSPSPPPLNERIVSSLARRSVAAHPWHDLDIGKRSWRVGLITMPCYSVSFIYVLCNAFGILILFPNNVGTEAPKIFNCVSMLDINL